MRFQAGWESEVTWPPYPPSSISRTSPPRPLSMWKTVGVGPTIVHSQYRMPAIFRLVSSPKMYTGKSISSSMRP